MNQVEVHAEKQDIRKTLIEQKGDNFYAKIIDPFLIHFQTRRDIVINN